MVIQENVVLAPLTTMQVGGPARYFIEASDSGEVRAGIEFARSKNAPLFVLGGGSNLVVSDRGWPGVVLKVAILGIKHRHGHGTAYFDVGAGEDWDGFVAATVGHNCSGIECLSGIPGSVGGTPVQNVGAYGQEVADTIDSVVAIDVVTGKEVEFEKDECGFAYRTSIFNTSARGKYVILRVSYALGHDGAPSLAYADLKKYFANRGQPPTLAEMREAVRQIRSSKSMLLTPGDEDCRSVGSFFKNPMLSATQFDELKQRAAARNLEVPNYPALEAQKKVSAAWLVERSGFSKGYQRGRVGLSSKHALAIVNRGGATAGEVVAFRNEIQRRVEVEWGIRLEPEPVFVGFG
ncbi:MAG TPA: UDP-N-acetylmuramate dehydrogenase [Terriglobales bacterium]|jgi:UDP-N-acetylmuramate dehydrogenase|nr:UDP-N-acetylmuramate dehydrogenase [Terriglobales bacterium]